jgi:predicted ATPase
VAYEGATHFAMAAVTLLGEHAWSRCYDLTKAVYYEAMLDAYLSSHNAPSDALAEQALGHLSEDLARADVFEIKARNRIACGKAEEGLDICIQALHALGWQIPAHPSKLEIASSFVRSQMLLARLGGCGRLRSLPEITDPIYFKYFLLAHAIGVSAYQLRPPLLAYLCCEGFCFLIKHGRHRATTSMILSYMLALLQLGNLKLTLKLKTIVWQLYEESPHIFLESKVLS